MLCMCMLCMLCVNVVCVLLYVIDCAILFTHGGHCTCMIDHHNDVAKPYICGLL